MGQMVAEEAIYAASKWRGNPTESILSEYSMAMRIIWVLSRASDDDYAPKISPLGRLRRTMMDSMRHR